MRPVAVPGKRRQEAPQAWQRRLEAWGQRLLKPRSALLVRPFSTRRSTEDRRSAAHRAQCYALRLLPTCAAPQTRQGSATGAVRLPDLLQLGRAMCASIALPCSELPPATPSCPCTRAYFLRFSSYRERSEGSRHGSAAPHLELLHSLSAGRLRAGRAAGRWGGSAAGWPARRSPAPVRW
jgi:hypothetical protein